MQLKDIAIVLLCYADFESLEIALAAHAKFLNPETKIFILQNGRGTYDCERTYKVAQRYADLFPKNIVVVDWIKPQKPYYAIKQLLNSKIMKNYSYICKVDDDVLPLTKNWLKDLMESYIKSHNKYADDLAYVTSLVNNNPWGFIKTLDLMNLKEEYFQNIAREHMAGMGEIVPKDQIREGLYGTVWHNPYISRWLHTKTTLNVNEFINNSKNADDCLVNHKERYSINCMLFKKDLWNTVNIGSHDDEHMFHQYCKTNDKKIVACCKVPMIHLFFFTQRDENKDLIPIIRNYYENWLNLPFPISMCPNKNYEIENRLRYIENKLIGTKYQTHKKNSFLKNIFSIRNSVDKKHKIITILGLKIKLKKIR